MNNAHNKKDRTLFVSMIHESVTDDDLYELLSQAGPIEKIILKQNRDGTPLHALVIFRNVESVVFSMNHILPMVRSSKLAILRPLRESSHQCSSAQISQRHPAQRLTEEQPSSYDVFHTTNCRTNWSPRSPGFMVNNSAAQRAPAKTSSSSVSSDGMSHRSGNWSWPTFIPVLGPVQNQPKSSTPLTTSPCAGYSNSYGSAAMHNPLHCPAASHVDNCSKICCART